MYRVSGGWYSGIHYPAIWPPVPAAGSYLRPPDPSGPLCVTVLPWSISHGWTSVRRTSETSLRKEQLEASLIDGKQSILDDPATREALITKNPKQLDEREGWVIK